MNGIAIRALSKLYRTAFSIWHRGAFRKIGTGASLSRPFRIDGADGVSIGPRTTFQRGAWLYCRGVNGRNASLNVGAGCAFGYNNHLTAVGNVVIGDNVLTANNVYISDNIHAYEDITTPIMHQPVLFKREVAVGDGTWIGENACIIGASVGRNCVIGANAVVTADVPDYSVAVGVPARVIRHFDPHLKQWVATNLTRGI